MWDELEKALKENEAVIRSGRGLPYSKRFGQQVRLGQLLYAPVVMTGERQNFPRVDLESPVASLLQLPTTGFRDYSLPFHELVEAGAIENSPVQRVLRDYSVMGFLVPGDGTARGHFVSPDRAVRLAEAPTEPMKGGATPTAVRGSDLPPTPANLENGVWHHIPTGTEFFINDSQYRSAAPGGAGNAADAPILALGNNVHRVLAVSADTKTWYNDYPPPVPPRDPGGGNAAYVRQLRSYLKKMSIQLIERDNWFLLWHGYLYTNTRAVDFRRVFGNSRHLANLGQINWPDNTTITEVDANNAATEVAKFTWGELKTAGNHRAVGTGPEARYAAFYRLFEEIGRELRTKYPQIFARRPLPVTEDIELTGDLLHALVEAQLDESLTYNQMLTATAQYWQSRLKTVRNVHTQPPGLVMLKDGTVDLSFDFVSRPSTTGRPHQGYVKFIPERGQPRLIDKLKDFLGRIGQQVKKFIGKKVPPQALKGSDLRKMLVEVSCSCPDFKYRMSYANVKAGVTSQAGRTDNGMAPVKTNPARRPGFCKHILATLRYLTDDAEIQISKELSREQQEALKKDRAQFYKEAQVAYERMKAPAAKGAEEIKPEEEEAPPEYGKLPAPPKPEAPPRPALPITPPTPITPDYPASQL